MSPDRKSELRWAQMYPGPNFEPNLGFAALAMVLSFTCSCRSRTHRQVNPVDTEVRHATTPSSHSVTASTASGIGQDGATAQTAACPHFSSGHRVGRLENDDLDEASDLVVSSKNPGVLWSHNDSGGKPQLFALTTSGRDLGHYHLEGASLVDWEDMAVAPGPLPDQSFLYVGDIGANNAPRETICVYRVEEPPVSTNQKPKKRRLGPVTRFDFVFPDRTSHDAESLMVDPEQGDLYFVTKPRSGAPDVYRAKAPLDSTRTATLELVARLTNISSGPMLPTLVTSGDIARDGSMILLRTYWHAYLWQRGPGETIDLAFSKSPCAIPLHSEAQGESIALSPDGKGYYTVSEGHRASIYFFERSD